MDLTLDYNVELFPLKNDQSFALALATSLSRSARPTGADGGDKEEQAVWRPDGKGTRGLEEDYDYVMYGKVRIGFFTLSKQYLTSVKIYKFDSGAGEIVYVRLFAVESLTNSRTGRRTFPLVVSFCL